MATANQIAIIRAFLPGLPDSITDETISIVIDASRNLTEAAMNLCDAAATAAIAVESEDIKIGSLAIKSTGKSEEYWLSVKDNIWKRYNAGGAVIIDPDAGGDTRNAGFGGVVTGQDIDNQFWTNQFGYYPATNPDYE